VRWAHRGSGRAVCQERPASATAALAARDFALLADERVESLGSDSTNPQTRAAKGLLDGTSSADGRASRTFSRMLEEKR
jgi:hypothetical protein